MEDKEIDKIINEINDLEKLSDENLKPRYTWVDKARIEIEKKEEELFLKLLDDMVNKNEKHS